MNDALAQRLDPGPMARLEALKADKDLPAEIFRLLTDEKPFTLAQIARLERFGFPKGEFVKWFTETHGPLYDLALKVRAADYAFDAMQAALEATPTNVAVKKLQVDVAKWLASRYDRGRFGESVRVEKSVTFEVDAGLVGTIGELLQVRAIAPPPPEKVIFPPSDN